MQIYTAKKNMLLNLYELPSSECNVILVKKNDLGEYKDYALPNFSGSAKEAMVIPSKEKPVTLLYGIGDGTITHTKEKKDLFFKLVKQACGYGFKKFNVNLTLAIDQWGCDILKDVFEGMLLTAHEYPTFKGVNDSEKKVSTQQEANKKEITVGLTGIKDTVLAEHMLQEADAIVRGIFFAKNMIHTPGNLLRPFDFANQISQLLKDLPVEVTRFTVADLEKMGMHALLSVGNSSEFAPCLMVLSYKANPENKEIYGYIGKGVTCDTGGYCLKSAGNMAGIKGDMAGAAAVAGAIYAIAKNAIKTNVIGVIPICENRISDSSLLPGDVIKSYSGKTIEILNTDAEGRLILADAISYAVKQEHVTKILDIATLTGAVATTFGNVATGVISNNDDWHSSLTNAALQSGERFWRLPIFPEYERTVGSSIADVKNQGESSFGTITAGLFLREFAEKKPWVHLDIAATANTWNSIYEYENGGPTGVGLTTMYYLCQQQ